MAAGDPNLTGLTPAQKKRQADLQAGFTTDVQPYLPPGAGGDVSPARQRQFERQVRQGRLKGVERLLINRGRLGYNQPEQQLTQEETQALAGGARGDSSQLQTPNLAAVSQYSLDRLGTGLTPQEEAAIRGPAIEAVEAGAAEGKRTTADALAASGIGPQSGATLAAIGGVERTREQGRAQVERDVTQADLARKGQIEQLAESQAGLEAQRQSDLEKQLGQESALTEGRREYDVGLVEARRQARAQRALLMQALAAAKPTGLEEISGILGGIGSGLQMGGVGQ